MSGGTGVNIPEKRKSSFLNNFSTGGRTWLGSQDVNQEEKKK
jgi:hypothetical protein